MCANSDVGDDQDAPIDLGPLGLDEDEAKTIIEDTIIEVPDGEMGLEDVMVDLAVAHKEISDYKNGALTLCSSLDEAIVEAEMADDNNRVEVLEAVKETAFGVYLRLKRGDAELLGNRDGKYSGYFDHAED